MVQPLKGSRYHGWVYRMGPLSLGAGERGAGLGKTWTWYVLRCADDSLYCGITTDLERRIDQHNGGQGSKYVWSRRPAIVVLHEDVGEKPGALKKEAAFKKLSKGQKEAVVQAAEDGSW